MLAVRAVDKSFGDRKALVGVTLDVAAGEVVLLVGRNGAGKTTLLRIITGFLDPDSGEVAIDGIDVATARVKAQAKLGYLPEHAPAPVEPIVRDHLYLRARLKGCRDPAAAVARVAAAVAIESELERTIGTLSKGYRQRVGLADALLGEPALLVLDEPTSGLDPLQVTEMREHISAIVSQSRRAALVSSHAVADLEPLATKVAVLREGVLVAFDTPANMRDKTSSERLETAVVKLLGETGRKK